MTNHTTRLMALLEANRKSEAERLEAELAARRTPPKPAADGNTRFRMWIRSDARPFTKKEA